MSRRSTFSTARRASRSPTREAGMTLIEAVVAIVVVVLVMTGVAHLLAWGRRATWSAGTKSVAVMLAVQKMEILQALPWEVDSQGVPVSDESTNVSAVPLTSDGTGLEPSPPNTLSVNTTGFADYLDADGRWLANGSRAPGAAAFVRRWSIEPFAPDALDTVVLTVVVLPHVDEAAAADFVERGARLTTIRTRVMRR